MCGGSAGGRVPKPSVHEGWPPNQGGLERALCEHPTGVVAVSLGLELGAASAMSIYLGLVEVREARVTDHCLRRSPPVWCLMAFSEQVSSLGTTEP